MLLRTVLRTKRLTLPLLAGGPRNLPLRGSRGPWPQCRLASRTFLFRQTVLGVCLAGCPAFVIASPDEMSSIDPTLQAIIAKAKAVVNTPSLFWIISVNTAVFATWRYRGKSNPFMMLHFTVSREHLKSGMIWTLITSSFSHQSAMHFGMNMLGLCMFGSKIVPNVLGDADFVKLYLASCIGGSLVSVLGNLRGPLSVSLGASAGVFGVLTAYALRYPSSTIYVLPLPFPIEVSTGLVATAVFSVFGAFFRLGRIDHAGHLGGIFASLAYLGGRVDLEKALGRRFFLRRFVLEADWTYSRAEKSLSFLLQKIEHEIAISSLGESGRQLLRRFVLQLYDLVLELEKEGQNVEKVKKVLLDWLKRLEKPGQ